MKLRILDKSNNELFVKQGLKIDCTYESEYSAGDKIYISANNCYFFKIQLDSALKETVVYAPSGSFEYRIPTEVLKRIYEEGAFAGTEHRIRVSEATDEEAYGERNISLNPYDLQGQKRCYPHAYANYVTRGEPCFFERNAIDGVLENKGHGNFPYHSWAGGARDDLEYYVDFGTEVEVEKLVFYLRADFPHDTYWKNIDIEFSDGEIVTANFEGVADGQEVVLKEKKITRTIHLTNFIQAVFPLSWAALSQIEVYGRYIKEDLSKIEIRSASNPKDVKNYTTERLREEFHIAKLFTKDNIRMVYSHIDRIITAGIMPVYSELKLEAGKELAADYFLQRREMGCINIGGKGIITVDGTEYEMNPRDGIYIGMGNKDISFKCVDIENPPKF